MPNLGYSKLPAVTRTWKGARKGGVGRGWGTSLPFQPAGRKAVGKHWSKRKLLPFSGSLFYIKTRSLNLRRRIKDWEGVSKTILYCQRKVWNLRSMHRILMKGCWFLLKFHWNFSGTLGLGPFALQNSKLQHQTCSSCLDLQPCRNNVLRKTRVASSIFPEQFDRLMGEFQTTGVWNNNIDSFCYGKIIPAQRRTEFWLPSFGQGLSSCV